MEGFARGNNSRLLDGDRCVPMEVADYRCRARLEHVGSDPKRRVPRERAPSCSLKAHPHEIPEGIERSSRLLADERIEQVRGLEANSRRIARALRPIAAPSESRGRWFSAKERGKCLLQYPAALRPAIIASRSEFRDEPNASCSFCERAVRSFPSASFRFTGQLHVSRFLHRSGKRSAEFLRPLDREFDATRTTIVSRSFFHAPGARRASEEDDYRFPIFPATYPSRPPIRAPNKDSQPTRSDNTPSRQIPVETLLRNVLAAAKIAPVTEA